MRYPAPITASSKWGCTTTICSSSSVGTCAHSDMLTIASPSCVPRGCEVVHDEPARALFSGCGLRRTGVVVVHVDLHSAIQVWPRVHPRPEREVRDDASAESLDL